MTETPQLAEYTESDTPTHDQTKRWLRDVLVNRDYDARLSAKELAAMSAAVSASTIRDLVAEVRRDYDLAVYSRGSGYWHLTDADEFEDAVKRIDDQIETKERTKRELARAYNRRRGVTITASGGEDA
jgi:hypothetical protein